MRCILNDRHIPRRRAFDILGLEALWIEAYWLGGNGAKRRWTMKVAMTGLTVIAAMSVCSHAAAAGGGRGLYNAQAAYGACQEDALRGVHYPMEGDCPNWQAWKARHMQVQTSPHRKP